MIGDQYEEQIFILKTALNQPSLSPDFQPPSAGKLGKTYKLFSDQVKEALALGVVHEIAPADELLERARKWLRTNPVAAAPWDVKGFSGINVI